MFKTHEYSTTYFEIILRYNTDFVGDAAGFYKRCMWIKMRFSAKLGGAICVITRLLVSVINTASEGLDVPVDSTMDQPTFQNFWSTHPRQNFSKKNMEDARTYEVEETFNLEYRNGV
jgi:hypothetical protein